MKSVQVALADAQILTRTALKSFLQERKDLKLVSEIEKREDFKRLLKASKPDVLVVDYNLDDFITLDDLFEVSKYTPKTKMLVISSDNNKEHIFKALEAGINGYVTKRCSKKEIVNAIYATAKGEKFFCNKVLDLILEKHLNKNGADRCDPTELTVREVEIVRLIADGHNAKKIADKLHLSHHTVYTHRKNVMKKLNLSTVPELMMYAIKTGIVKA